MSDILRRMATLTTIIQRDILKPKTTQINDEKNQNSINFRLVDLLFRNTIAEKWWVAVQVNTEHTENKQQRRKQSDYFINVCHNK